MQLAEAKAFAQSKIEAGFKSDGCTFAPDLNIEHCCEMHDVLLSYLGHLQISRHRADELFYEYMLEEGHRVIANTYWFFVRLQAAARSTVGLLMILLFGCILSAFFVLSS